MINFLAVLSPHEIRDGSGNRVSSFAAGKTRVRTGNPSSPVHERFKFMIIVALIVFFAALVQSSIGFGSALVAMPLLVGLLGIHIAAPLVAIAALLLEIVILLRYREAFNFEVVKHLAIATILGIPFGVLAVKYIESDIVNKILGIIVIGYALYALFAPKLPELAGKAWTYLFRFYRRHSRRRLQHGWPPIGDLRKCAALAPR